MDAGTLLQKEVAQRRVNAAHEHEQLVTAIADKLIPGRGWAIFFGIVIAIAGVVVLAYPFDSVVTLALVVGVSLIVLAVIEVISGFGMRGDAKKVESFVGAGMQPHGVAH